MCEVGLPIARKGEGELIRAVKKSYLKGLVDIRQLCFIKKFDEAQMTYVNDEECAVCSAPSRHASEFGEEEMGPQRSTTTR